MRRETYFKNDGPMGNGHSHLKVFRTVYGNKIDMTIINNPDDDGSMPSYNVVLSDEQVKQLINLLNNKDVDIPPANIFTIGE